jgi:PHD/YefM family antitoxin component YafN of YafNO toxin-antitoxin module
MKMVDLRNASGALGDYVAALGSEAIVVTSKNRPVAALVSLKNVDRESLALSLNPQFMQIIRRARGEVRRGKVYSLRQIKQEIAPRRNRRAGRTSSVGAAGPKRDHEPHT